MVDWMQRDRVAKARDEEERSKAFGDASLPLTPHKLTGR